MNIIRTISEFIRAKKLSSYSRKQIIYIQNKLLKKTLINAYNKSPFYRNLWEKYGITKENLLKVPFSKFPIVTKKELMENFESVATKPDIKKIEIEKLIMKDKKGEALYKNKYIALNTSGSSGYIGIFIFTKKFWSRLLASIIARVLKIPWNIFLKKKIRLAFVGEPSGHHAGAMLVRSAPSFIFDVFGISLSVQREEIIKSLNKFNPDILSGYASNLADLAEDKLNGKLKIKPKTIISSGEPLTNARKKIIKLAFNVTPFDLYGATECLAIGSSISGSNTLNIFDNLIFVEVVDERGNLLAKGKIGRIIITVLGNDIQPLIRYSLDDKITLKKEDEKRPFTQASSVTGRDLECLLFKLPQGEFTLYPMEVVGFFFPGLKHYQIIQTSQKSICLKIAAEGNKKDIKKKIFAIIKNLFKEKNLPKNMINLIDIKIELVKKINPNPKTGKTPILVPLRHLK